MKDVWSKLRYARYVAFPSIRNMPPTQVSFGQKGYIVLHVQSMSVGANTPFEEIRNLSRLLAIASSCEKAFS